MKNIKNLRKKINKLFTFFSMHNVKCKNTKQMIISNTDIHATKVILSLSEVILSTACQIQSQSVLFLKGQECKKGIAEPMTCMFFCCCCCCFFLSGFSFTSIHDSQDCRGRGRAFL